MKYNDDGTIKEIKVKSFDTLPVGTEVDYDGSTVPDGWTEVADPNEYSTTEHRIGTWINGKPLYRKIVNGTFGTVTQGTQSEVEIQIPNADFLLIDKYWIDRRIENSAINQGFATDVIYTGYTSFTNDNAIIRLRTKQDWVSNNSVYAIVLYTKSTD